MHAPYINSIFKLYFPLGWKGGWDWGGWGGRLTLFFVKKGPTAAIIHWKFVIEIYIF